MKYLVRFCVFALAAAVGTGVASADSLSIVSFGTATGGDNSGYTAPAGVLNTNGVVEWGIAVNPDQTKGGSLGWYDEANTVTKPPIDTPKTYNINGSSPWLGAIGSSSWVSTDPASDPAGGDAPADGVYTYATSFNLTASEAADDLLTLTLLADDTTSVYLLNSDNVLIPILDNSVGSGNGTCDNDVPNCVVEDTVTFGGFTAGENTLIFGVDQTNLSATGLDFSGTLAPAPEPSSLMLLGTSLLGAAEVLRRRLRA